MKCSLSNKHQIIKGEYIFYYTPGCMRHEFLAEASQIGHQMGLPVIYENCYPTNEMSRYDNIKSYPAVGPIEFLNLIKNATFVCGASFHLMVFSLIFGKMFCCMNGDVDSRMENLMRLAGAEDHVWSIVDKSKNIISDKIVDYQNLFEEMREKSILFLKSNL